MRILAIGAHADDVEISCAGTLLKAGQKGHEVKIIIMSRSDYRNYDGKVLRTKQQVTSETKKAFQLLGIKQSAIYPYKTKQVPYDYKSVEKLDREISAFNPDIIITHWPHDSHQDHVNTSKSVIAAARYRNSILFFEPVMPSGRSYHDFSREVYVDVSSAYHKKEDVIKAHKSQYKKYGNAWLEAVRAKDRERGFEMGVKYAEAYQVMRWEWKI